MTKAEIRANFEVALDRAVTLGDSPSSIAGFHYKVEGALFDLAFQYPNTTKAAIDKARKLFEQQMDGTLAREQAASAEATLRARGYA
ncbi:hypothetical protein LV457_04155 [Mycobacterium sp. MYCO198283]|uniref:hypothetical protein n=1 Tax=Mycobacterium sp. MYCO198283 TaxID=2883505 RepID=UPI001E434591|nr:hypothetical protein [Mycobacterium sp. MYCO198283]MCG5431484.1 hypothetical protein [Mycobacterium sp. MYCO198283]